MKILSENLRIRYRDVNREGRLKALSWFGFMQEIAADHAEALGFGYHGMTEFGIFWVLERMKLRIMRQPTVEETITLETWPGTFRRLFAARHFRFTDGKGKVVALASSQWMTLSLENGRPQRVEVIGDRCPDTSDLPVHFEFTTRLAAVPPEGEAQLFPVRYSMEDVNGHLNNAEYMAIAQDAAEQLAGHPLNFNELEIVFHAAVRAPETLRVHTAPEGEDGRLVSGYREDGTLSFCAALRDPEPAEEPR